MTAVWGAVEAAERKIRERVILSLFADGQGSARKAEFPGVAYADVVDLMLRPKVPWPYAPEKLRSERHNPRWVLRVFARMPPEPVRTPFLGPGAPGPALERGALHLGLVPRADHRRETAVELVEVRDLGDGAPHGIGHRGEAGGPGLQHGFPRWA